MVRAYVTPAEPEPQRLAPASGPARPRAQQVPSPWTLIFDTETTTDLGQRLRLITYQVRKNDRLVHRGIATAPRLPAADRAAITDYCRRHHLDLLNRDDFLNLFFRIGVDRRGSIVGFNLPFDLSRLASRHAASKPRRGQKKMRGGFTFTLSPWATRPPIQVKRISPRAAFIQFTAPEGRLPEHRNAARGGTQTGVFRGYFIDVATLAGALLGRKGKLSSLAATLNVEQKLTIDEATLGGPVTDQLLDYAMTDVQVTWECYQALCVRYQQLGLSTPVHRILSEASIAKAHLTDLGLRPWRDTQPNPPSWLIATALETYYGGRTETRIRRTLTPGVLTDLLSEYPTVFVLQQLSRYLIATGVDWTEENPHDTTAWLQALTVQRMLDPTTWPHLTRLVQLRPRAGDLLPTRADYAGDGVFNVALAHRLDGPDQWYTLADAAASTLATGKPPTITRTLTFTPQAAQQGLRPLLVAGRHTLDPYAGDLIATLVQLRSELKNDPDPHIAAAAPAIKATVNSVAYGIPIEVNTTPEAGGTHVTVHQPDGATYDTKVPRTEEPGQFFHPLLATWVAGAGRLLLALIMRMVKDLNGSYAFCDTDSLFIAATQQGGMLTSLGGTEKDVDGTEAIRLLTWQQVADIADRLTALNPYGGLLANTPILKIEADNYEPITGMQRQIYAYAVASKRYALLTLDPSGNPRIITDPTTGPRRSEHGLGHLLPPAGLSPADFHDQWWNLGLHAALGLPHPEPKWLDEPALGRLTVTNPTDDRAFTTYNTHRRYDDHIRPWTFASTATPTPREQGRTGTRLLIAPYSKDRRKQGQAHWADRNNPSRSYRLRTGNDHYVLDDTITVNRLRDYAGTYFTHPESKADDQTGQPCRTDTVGVLQAPHVSAAARLGRIGKETNRVTADTDQADLDQVGLVYEAGHCKGCSTRVARRIWCSERCRKRYYRVQQAASSAAAGLEH